MTRTGIKLDLDVGDLVSNAARAKGAIAAITEEMKKAEMEKRYEDYAKLSIQKARLESQNSGFVKDIKTMTLNPNFQTAMGNGTTTLKMDSEYGQRLKGLNDSIKILTSKYEEQIQSGDLNSANDTFAELEKSQRERHKTIEEATAPEWARGKAMQNSMKAVLFGQIANSINDGLKIWANSLDRSGIVNAFGSGDIFGGRLAEKQRTADIFGGGAQVALGTGGAAATALGHPEIGVALTALGQLVNNLTHAPINAEKTDVAYAGLWQQRSADAMKLAAQMGDPKQVRDAFKIAADAAAAFGFSAEDGMDAIKQATQQGLTGKEAVAAAKQVFDYERSTGADRGTLSSLVNMSARFNAGDALKAGWAGLHVSGMTPGRYNEFLRGIYRVMEEGVSKGFVKSADQVATSFTMLSQMSGNDPLWQGEHGARRLSDINAGMESATGLKSATDIRVFRAAKKIAMDEGLGDSYWEAMKIMEAGLGGKYGTRLLHETMKLNMAAEGGGIKDVGESVRQQFGFNYTLTDKFLEDWLPYKDKDSRDFASFWESQKAKYDNTPLPDVRSPELEWAQLTAQTANIVVQTGQIKFDEAIPMLREERKKAEEELNNVRNGKGPADISTLTPEEGVEVRRKELQKTAEMTGTGTGIMGGGFGKLTQAYRNLQDAEKTAAQTTFGIGDVERLRTRSTATVNSLFDTSLLLPQNQRETNERQQSKMLGTFGKALESNDESQIQAVADALKIFESASKETREEWNASGKLNSLANQNVMEILRQLHSDMLEMTSELRDMTVYIHLTN